jgi:hypothetical protein
MQVEEHQTLGDASRIQGDPPHPQHIRGDIIANPHQGAELIEAEGVHDVVFVFNGRAT